MSYLPTADEKFARRANLRRPAGRAASKRVWRAEVRNEVAR